MNLSLGQELLNEADHIDDPDLRIIERFNIAIFLYSKTIRMMPSALGTYPLMKLLKK